MVVCGAVGAEVLSSGRTKLFGPSRPLRVGRVDRAVPPPPNTLPAGDQQTGDWATFWAQRGFTVEEAMALQGSHATIDDQVK